MFNVVTLFGMPLDKPAFDDYFTSTHQPLLLQVPNVVRVVTNRVAGAAQGASPYCLIVELYFATEEAMQQGLNSEAGRAMARDLAQFASGGVTVLFSEATVQSVNAQ